MAQTWRAAEPRYPPHGISYPVQIARPHAVRGTDVRLGPPSEFSFVTGFLFLPGVGAGVTLMVSSQGSLSPVGKWGDWADTTAICGLARSRDIWENLLAPTLMLGRWSPGPG